MNRRRNSTNGRILRGFRNAMIGTMACSGILVSHLFGQGSAGSGAASNRTSDNAFFCKSRDFNIPFNIASTGRTPQELELELSSDGGVRWSPLQRAKPDSKSFHFQAPSDGYYLFRLNTIDSSGRVVPTGDQPLQVIVDSQKPSAELSVDTDEQGLYVARFTVVDPNLNLDAVRIQFRTEREEAWQDVEAVLGQGSEEFEVRGTSKFDVPIGVKQLVVRLIAKDQADNEVEVFRYPQMPKTAQAGGGLKLASQKGGMNSSVRIASRGGTNNLLAAQERPSNDAEPVLLPVPQSSASKPTMTNAPVRSSEKKLDSMSRGQGSNGFEPSEVGPDGKYVLRPFDSEDVTSKSPANNNMDIDLEPAGVMDLDTNTKIYPFYSLSKSFSLDYDLQAHPAIGIQAVELWGTTDGGRTWDNWGADADRASPMEVAVEEEGLFGFRIVVVSGNGVISNRPQPGDAAEVWVDVDTQLPSARIVAAQYGQGAELGSLVIQYQVADDHLSDQPITLTFSESADGPWVTIATGIKNTGKFLWPADPTLPRRVYLRLEAMDNAGNIGEHRFGIPVDIAGLSPHGRIQGVRPIKK